MTTINTINTTLPGISANKAVSARKRAYATKLKSLFDEYDSFLIVSINNVGSKQINEMRKDFRGRARFVFGKNTLIRKVLRDYIQETGNIKFMHIMEKIKGNVGFVFTKHPSTLFKEIRSRKKQCAAKVGTIAPVDVYIPPGPTGMEPTRTFIFQSMEIPTRINRGQIDVEKEIHLIKKGTKVGLSQSSLLSNLGIKPFYYGMKIEQLYENGELYGELYINGISTEDVIKSFREGVKRVSAFCYGINHPIIVNVPHSLLNAYQSVIALGLTLDTYSWNGLDEIREEVNSIQQTPSSTLAPDGNWPRCSSSFDDDENI